MNISLLAVHMHDLLGNRNKSIDCSFGAGPIGQSSYTAINCELRRRNQVAVARNVAYEDSDATGYVSQAFKTYYQARFMKQTITNSSISVITPPELRRFYQVYTVIKDTQLPLPVTRRLNVEIQVVQISAVFLTCAMLAALLIFLGSAHYTWFAVSHRDTILNTPQSKLDWMMQSIQTEDRPLSDDHGRTRWSVTVESAQALAGRPNARRRRREFGAAKYGVRATTTWFARDSTPTTDYGASP